jgi:hypothetical protein
MYVLRPSLLFSFGCVIKVTLVPQNQQDDIWRLCCCLLIVAIIKWPKSSWKTSQPVRRTSCRVPEYRRRKVAWLIRLPLPFTGSTWRHDTPPQGDAPCTPLLTIGRGLCRRHLNRITNSVWSTAMLQSNTLLWELMRYRSIKENAVYFIITVGGHYTWVFSDLD